MKHVISHTALILGSISCTVPIAFAQTANSGGKLEEVQVTARRQSESIQSTPVAVAALNTAALENAQVTEVLNLTRVTPTLTMSNGGPGGAGNIYLAIRGQSKTEANSATDAAVAIYVNGVNYARMTSGNFSLFDLAQVEVLRGPQGTLFGRNTTGGALNITTVQPGNEFGGYLKGGFGNFGSKLYEGAVDVPIKKEELALRVAGSFESNDGAFDNKTTGQSFKALDHGWGVRATLNWEPANLPIKLSIVGDKAEFEDNGSPNSVLYINSGLAPLGPTFPTIGALFAANNLNPNDYLYRKGKNFDEVYGDARTGRASLDKPYDIGKQHGLSATLDWDIGDVHVKSITATRSNDATNSQDLDGTPLRLLSFASVYEQDQVSEELQASTTLGNLDLIGGLFYFKEHGIEQSVSDSFGALGVVPIGLNLSDFESKSRAVFAQANYHFTSKLRGTLGYRYTWDDRSITKRGLSGYTIAADGSVASALGAVPFDASFSYPAWVLGVDYQATDDMFLYAKTGRASMAGGFNTRGTPTGLESFDPEELTDIEVGMKLDSLDHHLRTNVSVFGIETKNVQRTINGVVNNRSTQYTQNAGDTQTYGMEFEATALPWDGTELSFSAVYLNAKYKSGTFIEDRGTPASPLIVDRSDEDIPNAPEWTYNVSASQEFNLDFAKLTAQLTYSWVGDKSIGATTAAPGATAQQVADVELTNKSLILDGYGLLSGRLTMALQNGVEVSLWGQNLTNEEYFTFAFNAYNTLGFATQAQGMPRTFGLQAKYSF